MHTLKLSLVLLVFLTAGCESLQKIPNSNEEFNLETLSGSDQQVSVGQTSNPLIVRVIGSDGQPTEGASIRWSVSPAGFADFASSETQTNSNGEAQATLSITKAGPISVTADAGPTGTQGFN
jgi:hypothetical protein